LFFSQRLIRLRLEIFGFVKFMSKKILIVEDEPFISEMYKIKFDEQGYRTLVAHDGEEGIKLAKKELPDLILLDLILPKKNGYQVLEELRRDKKTKNLKIYILSNLEQSEEVATGLKKGADGYFVKANLTPSQLINEVKQIFSGKKTETNDKKLDVLANKKVINNKKNKLKVLLIEDEEALVNMYKLRLAKAGYEVAVARNGAWGVKLASQKPFDVIIVDMVMPAMNGYQAIKEFKNREKTKKIPIIVLSNSAQEKDIEQAKRCGVTCYLLKSQITPAKLVEEVKRVIKK